MLCPFSVGLTLAPKGIFEVGPSGNRTHLPVSFSHAEGGNQKVPGMLGSGLNCDPLLRRAKAQAEGVARPPGEGPGGWMVEGTVLHRRVS